MRCAIWYHLQNLKNVKNTHGRVLILVKVQAYQIGQRTTYKWIRKLRKTSFFLTSQPAVKIHIFTNISRIKDSQTMKFGRSIEYNIRKILSKNYAENVFEKLLPYPFFN